MEIKQAQWGITGDKVQFTLPIAKVDKEQRTVSGFATLDNVDGHGDVVTAAASKQAFEKWRGNIREMHDRKAVGRALRFEEKEFFDPDSQKVYKGIYVTARISKGAQDTWEKVLDGTLNGFSVGGKILKKREEFNKDISQLVRYVDEYSMEELSLVDGPANNLANVLSIQKTADGVEATGLALMKSENVLFCRTDEYALVSEEDIADCIKCGSPLENIGWVESSDENKAELVKSLITKATTTSDEGTKLIEMFRADPEPESVGGAPVAEEVKETAAPAEPAKDEEVLEKAAEVSEVEAPAELDADKLVKDISAQVVSAVQGALTEQSAKVDEVKTSFTEEISKLASSFEEFKSGVEERLGKLDERVTTVASGTAVKKSGELEKEPEEKLEKTESIWSGSFLGVANLTT